MAKMPVTPKKKVRKIISNNEEIVDKRNFSVFISVDGAMA